MITGNFHFIKHHILLFLLLIFNWSAFAQTTAITYLSGTDKDHTVLWDFMCSSGRNSGHWSKIAVPSNWELQGFGNFNYGWEKNDGEDGYYKHTFTTSPSWKDKRIQLVFEGAMTDTEVKINGKSAGKIHQGAFYRFKYDITSLIKSKGENLLEVTVHKVSADTSVNRAERMTDFWVFGGIYRPVYLEILPRQFIDWTAIDAREDGTFNQEIHPSKVTDANEFEAQIYTLSGIPVGEPFYARLKKGQDKVLISTKVQDIKSWNPESPNLYKVELKMKNPSGTVHSITEKFGFRTIEFKKGLGFYVNGQKIMFKGANRHSFWPASGRTTSKEISILDINLMKDMNMNAVRMSHYPPDAHFLDACDSLGLFVLDELGGWQKKYDTPVGKKLVKEMVVKDVNHPSIVIWDNGNEGGNNFDLDDEFARYDLQKRIVIHPWNIFRGTDTQHYKGYDCCGGSLYKGNNVFFPTEMLHGLYDGGNGAGLNDHWNLMRSNPLSAGGFLWSFADEGILRSDQGNTVDVKGNLAPDGIVGPYREKEASFYTIKEIWNPVQIEIKKLLQDFNGDLQVKNYYNYTNLNQVSFKWETVKLTGPNSLINKRSVIAEGELKGPPVLPQQSGVLKLDLPKDFRQADVLYLTATDQYGRQLWTWSWPLKTPTQISSGLRFAGSNLSKVSIKEGPDDLVLAANGVAITFSKKTGLLIGVKNTRSKISFNNGPVLASGKALFQGLNYMKEGNNVIVELTYKGDMKKLKYIMAPSGILKMEYAYSNYGANPQNEFEYLGISFFYPEEKITGVKYLGRGPYRVWKNRMKGTSFGVWDKEYNNTVTGESWNYPEFKGYYSDFNWVVIENKECPFTIFTETPDLFLRLYTPQKPKAAGNNFTSPDFPSGDISILNGINGIGTKVDGPENNGPEGSKNKVGWAPIEGVLYFDFTSK